MKKTLFDFLVKIKSDRKKLIAVVIVLALGGYFLFNRYIGGEEEPAIQTVQVQRGTIVSSITASGSIISSNIENVTTQASGTVSRVYISDGDEVYAGQKLAEIDLDVQGEQNYASSYSTYISAASSLNTAKSNRRFTEAALAVVYGEIQGNDDSESLEMKEDRTRAEVANDNAYDAIKTAEARLSSASLALKTSSPTITSPVSGIIKSVTVAEGMNIGAAETASGARANQRVATIATEGLPVASFNVSEIDVLVIVLGQKATITVDAIADKTFTGKVVSLDRTGSVIQGVVNYPVLIALDTTDKQLLPNMSVIAEVILSSKSNVLTVPVGAIRQSQGRAVVSILVNGQAQEKEVETGMQTPTQVEIVSGLNEGDIIISGQRQVGGEAESQFGGQGRGGFGGGALRPGGFSGGTGGDH